MPYNSNTETVRFAGKIPAGMGNLLTFRVPGVFISGSRVS